MAAIRGAQVAANSAVWRVVGVAATMRVDVFGKAHVEHLVGFVEHQDLEGAQIESAPPQVVERAARRRHDDVDAAAERADLLVHRRPAVKRARR